jgi:hypothetical protein
MRSFVLFIPGDFLNFVSSQSSFLLKVGVEVSIANCRIKTQITQKVRLDLNNLFKETTSNPFVKVLEFLEP